MHKLSISAIETLYIQKSGSSKPAQNPNKFLNLRQRINECDVMWGELFCYTKYKFSSVFVYPFCGCFLCMFAVGFMWNCISFHANSVKILKNSMKILKISMKFFKISIKSVEIIVRNWNLVIFSSVCAKINRFLLNNRTNSRAKGNSYLTK